MHATLSELAAIDGMPSEPTLRKMIAADPEFPGILKRGSNGDAYEIDVEAAVRHIIGMREQEREDQRQRGQELRQFAMDLGLGAEQPAEPGLTVSDRKALLEEELVAIKVGKARGDLVAKASVEGAVAEVLVWHQQQTETFAARLSRRIDLPRPLQIEIETMMSADRAEFARRLRDIGEIGATGDGDSSDAPAAAVDDTAG